jgi:surfeit locus 1 family protein
MRFANIEFSPGLWPSLITLILLGILISLGFWQLDRAEQKRALLAGYDVDQNATVIQLEADFRPADDPQYQFASAVGYYDSAHQFLLDNRTHRGQAGYHVLTPFKLRESQVAVLVNRGWIPMGASRGELPDPDVGAVQQSITGRIKRPLAESFMLGEEEPRSGWPYRIQRVNTGKLEKELGYSLLPIVLLLDSEQQDGFVRDWKPFVRFGPEKNVGYAVQWFGLAAALLIIYLVVNTKKMRS